MKIDLQSIVASQESFCHLIAKKKITKKNISYEYRKLIV